MGRWGMVVTVGGALLLLAGQADAQWRYTDDKGTSRVTQYRIDIPADLRDAWTRANLLILALNLLPIPPFDGAEAWSVFRDRWR